MSDAKAALEQIASEVFGERLTVQVVTTEAAPRDEPAAPSSPLRDDPVVQAFRKHLGGEVVETRRSK